MNRILCVLGVLLIASCSTGVKIQNGMLRYQVNANMQTKVSSLNDNKRLLMNKFTNSEQLVTDKFSSQLFRMKRTSFQSISDIRGKGRRYIVEGVNRHDGFEITKKLLVTVYDSFPGMILTKVIYCNTGKRNIGVDKWVNNQYQVLRNDATPSFWSFQGSSSAARKDWILPVDSSFYQRNFMGLNNPDYGGGIPVADLWRKNGGLAVGHVEMVPKQVSLPVEKNQYDNYARLSVQYDYATPKVLFPGDSLETVTTFVAVHQGDCFSSLTEYSRFMQASGLKFTPEEPDAFEAVWCAWGYLRKFTLDEVVGTLPKVKELGLKWVDIDDGYQKAEGDWNVEPGRFPAGSADMRRLVDTIHGMGMKAKLWWAPLAVDPCSDLLRANSDLLLLTKDGTPEYITWWDSYYMSPSYFKTIDHTKQVIELFLKKWDFDGLKMDGQQQNCVAEDFNPKHTGGNPEETPEKLPLFFKMINETAKGYKPHAVLQICPCGCTASYFNLPYLNQSVASDPTSSWQVRHRSKIIKALRPGVAYYGDHVELTDDGSDFASQIGIGAVLGTKFTWPGKGSNGETAYVLTPEKEKIWKKWIAIYNEKMLSRNSYLGGLYDIGYDLPETHIIQKGNVLYYAFYNPDWNGSIELRGLGKGVYRVLDYENNKDMGEVSAANPVINVRFTKHLLIEVTPVAK